MKIKIFLILMVVVALWSINNQLLNEVTKKEKLVAKKEKELEEYASRYDEAIILYDKTVDLEKIKNELEKKGLKATRNIKYFKVREDSTIKDQSSTDKTAN